MRVILTLFLALFCLALFAPTGVQVASAPVLLTKSNSTRAIAVESTNLTVEPFNANPLFPFGADNRTRVMLFASNLTLLPGETAANVSAAAEDANHFQYPLTVEYISAVFQISRVSRL